MKTAVIAVVQRGMPTICRLEKAGWDVIRANAHTVTWMRNYDDPAHALLDAKTLPADVVWGMEATA